MPVDTPPRSEGAVAYATRNARIARRLMLALIVTCAAMMLLGPTIAESVLALLGCRGDGDYRLVDGLVCRPFAAFFRADQFVDVPFIFLVQFWPAIVGSLGLILYVRYRKPPEDSGRLLSLVEDFRRRSLTYRWARRLAWVSLVSLVVFCVLLGTPLVATETARLALASLGCDVDPWRIPVPLLAFGSGRSPPACLDWPGFWIPRLRDYVATVDGWFIAPYLLGLHFGWLILAWAGISALLFALARHVRRRELGE